MTRRLALALAAAAAIKPVRADAAGDTWRVIAAMAASLAEDNVPAFLKLLDPKLPGYTTLAANVQAIVEQADAHSGITPMINEGSDTARTLQVDWELRLTRKGAEGRMLIREEAVSLTVRRDGKHWRVSKLDPLSFFAPPDFR